MVKLVVSVFRPQISCRSGYQTFDVEALSLDQVDEQNKTKFIGSLLPKM